MLMKRILVAGGGGFIAAHSLQPLVAAGFAVHVVDLKPCGKDVPENVVWHQADLMNSDDVKKVLHEVRPSHLLNFAWFVRHGEYLSSPENFNSLTSNFRLLQQFADAGGKRVVMAGTCFEYDFSSGICDEKETRVKPVGVYGSCKLAMYEMLKSYAQVYGLSWAWGRIFFVFGPAEDPRRFVPAIIQPLLKGQPALCSHGNQIRDFMATQDVGSAFAALASSELQGAINIASGQPISLKQIVKILEKETNTIGLTRFGAVASPAEEPPMILAAVTRLHNELGWAPVASIEQRLAEAVQWWQRNV